MKSKTINICVKLPLPAHASLAKLASQNQRSLSGEIRFRLEKSLQHSTGLEIADNVQPTQPAKSRAPLAT